MNENTNLPEKELPALIGTIEDVPAGTIKNALVTTKGDLIERIR